VRTRNLSYPHFRTIILLCILCFVLPASISAQNQDIAWGELLQGRAVALIRHATAPGTGDPPGFRMDDCSTQRNLSQEGRVQAQRIGTLSREKGIKEAAVYASQWCRCLETARLLDFGPVKEFPALNSFFQDSSTEVKQTNETLQFIMSLPTGKATILVTHQVSITALTGIVPSSDEIIIVQQKKGAKTKVLGRFSP
jgi:phosphohistidine phosphatase SixA